MKAVRIVLWVLVAVVGAGLGGFAVMQLTGNNDQVIAKPVLGGPFNLVNHNGEPVTETLFAGKPHAVFFGFTHCPDICPTTLYELDNWMQDAGLTTDDIGIYFISVDPDRDTPELLKDYIEAVSPTFVGLTGTLEQSQIVQQNYRVYSKRVPLEDGDYTMDHSASVLLFDKNGEFVRTISFGENSDTAVQKLKLLAGKA